MTVPNENSDSQNYDFSDQEIKSVVKTKQDFIDGKTMARDWTDIEKDLDLLFRESSNR